MVHVYAKCMKQNGMPATIGFVMDRQLNGFGATGWDFLKCNPYGPMKRKMVK
jgi:hypothetical protein